MAGFRHKDPSFTVANRRLIAEHLTGNSPRATFAHRDYGGEPPMSTGNRRHPSVAIFTADRSLSKLCVKALSSLR